MRAPPPGTCATRQLVPARRNAKTNEIATANTRKVRAPRPRPARTRGAEPEGSMRRETSRPTLGIQFLADTYPDTEVHSMILYSLTSTYGYALVSFYQIPAQYVDFSLAAHLRKLWLIASHSASFLRAHLPSTSRPVFSSPANWSRISAIYWIDWVRTTAISSATRWAAWWRCDLRWHTPSVSSRSSS